jgi:hypothetical protein
MRRSANCTRIQTDRPSPNGEEEILFREVFLAVEDFLEPAERADLLSVISRFEATEGGANTPATYAALIGGLAQSAGKKGADPWHTSTKDSPPTTPTGTPPRRS